MIDVGTPVIIINNDKYVRFAVSLWLEEDLKTLCKDTATEFAFYLKDYRTFTRNDIVYYIIPYQEIIIPKQRTTTAHVEITETMPYPITGHKHPVAIPSFSDYDTQNIIPNSNISILVTENGIQQASIKFPVTIANTQYAFVIITSNILKFIDTETPTSLNDNKINEIHEKAVPQYVETTFNYHDIYYDYFDNYYEGKRRKRK